MKKLYRLLAAVFAVALIVASPATAITSHALGFNGNFDGPDDTTDYGEAPEITDWDDFLYNDDSSSSDNGSSYDEPSEPAPAPVPEPAPSVDNSSSHNTVSYDSGSSHDGGSSSISTSSNSSVSNAPKNNSNDKVVSVTGGQKFRIVMNADHTAYQVYHCGISRASFAVTNAEGNAVAFSTVALEKGDDGLWYLNTTFAEGVDTKDFTITVTKGDATYLSTTLGVSGIKLNGTVALSTVPATEAK